MRKVVVLAAVLAVTLSACAQPGGNGYGLNKRTGGAVLGGVGGALVGAQFGGGTGKLAATALGTLLGAWLGSEAGASMDRADQTHAEQRRGYRQQPQIQWNDPSGDAPDPSRH